MKYKILLCISGIMILAGLVGMLLPYFLTLENISQSTTAPAPRDLAVGISAAIPWMFFGICNIVAGMTLCTCTLVMWRRSINEGD